MIDFEIFGKLLSFSPCVGICLLLSNQNGYNNLRLPREMGTAVLTELLPALRLQLTAGARRSSQKQLVRRDLGQHSAAVPSFLEHSLSLRLSPLYSCF